MLCYPQLIIVLLPVLNPNQSGLGPTSKHMTNRQYWEAISQFTESETIVTLENAVKPFGYILDFKRFSDLALSVDIEVKPACMLPLWEAMSATFRMSGRGESELPNDSEMKLFLHISFAKGSGLKRFEVPAVPG